MLKITLCYVYDSTAEPELTKIQANIRSHGVQVSEIRTHLSAYILYTLNKISNWSLLKLIISDQALIALK